MEVHLLILMFIRNMILSSNSRLKIIILLVLSVFMHSAHSEILDSLFRKSIRYNKQHVSLDSTLFLVNDLDSYISTKLDYRQMTPFQYNHNNDTIYIIETLVPLEWSYSIRVISSLMSMWGNTDDIKYPPLRLFGRRNDNYHNYNLEYSWITTWETDSLKKYGIKYPPHIRFQTNIAYRIVNRIIIKEDEFKIEGVDYWDNIDDEFIPH